MYQLRFNFTAQLEVIAMGESYSDAYANFFQWSRGSGDSAQISVATMAPQNLEVSLLNDGWSFDVQELTGSFNSDLAAEWRPLTKGNPLIALSAQMNNQIPSVYW